MSVTAWSSPAFAAVAALLGARTGLAFDRGRLADAEAAIRRSMAKARVAEVSTYRQRLIAGQASLDDLIAEITVGETYFFREPDQLDFIRRTVLPEICRRRGISHCVRVWSAGCASGEEAYSLAILLEEEGFADRSQVLATDISNAALKKARQGVYGRWSLRGKHNQRLVERHFRPQGQRFVLAERIRKRVRFAQLNLAGDDYPSPVTHTVGLDLILCRNVLIYLDRAVIQKVMRGLVDSLADGGWLVTGPSDPILPAAGDLEVVTTPGGLFYRRRTSLPPRRGAHPMAARSVGVEDAPAERAKPKRRAAQPAHPERIVEPRAPHDESAAAGVPTGEAPSAFARGDYARAAELAARRPEDPGSCALRIRALANLGELLAAERASSEAVTMHAAAPELHFLRAVILTRHGRRQEAIRSIRRVIYLDRSLAVAHTTLGLLLQQTGDRAGALAAFRRARTLAAASAPDAVLPLSDGETAAQLARAAGRQVTALEQHEGGLAWR